LKSAASTTIAVPCWSSWKTQLPLDLEAARRGDVLEVDAAEGRGDRLDRADDLVGIRRRETDREGVDAGELLEQDRLALHHWQGRLRPDVAEAEHRRSVADDRDRVALDREVPDLLRILGDRARDAADAGRVDHREVVPGVQRVPRMNLELAAEVGEEDTVRDVDDLHALDGADGGDNGVEVPLVVGEDVDVADLRRALDADEVDRAEQAAGLADRRREAGERARMVLDPDADRGAEGR
jgi:hypothetical protein